MSSFPPLNWEVRYIEDMDKIFLDEGSSMLSVAALTEALTRRYR